MKNEITPTPWHLTSEGIKSESKQWYIIGEGEASPADSAAIVLAINSTYGYGISPESVPLLLDALKGMLDAFSHIGGVGWESKLKASTLAKSAIEQSKL